MFENQKLVVEDLDARMVSGLFPRRPLGCAREARFSSEVDAPRRAGDLEAALLRADRGHRARVAYQMTPARRLVATVLCVVVWCLALWPGSAAGQAPGHPGLSPFSLEGLEREAESWFEQPYLTGTWGGLR